MKDRGKAVEASTFFSDTPCKKHPSSSSVGICAFCLKDRLIKLVCSDCGEQRLSSCSCSDISSSYRNSCSVEVGSVGRISFLIENDTAVASESAGHLSKVSLLSLPSWNSKLHCREKHEAASLLKRNSSSSVFEKRRDFWHLGWIFKKKRAMGVSSSRSVCGLDESDNDFGSIRDEILESGDGFGGTKMGGFRGEEGSFVGRILENGGDLDSMKRDDFLQSESGFIDLKFGLDGERNSESAEGGFMATKRGGLLGEWEGSLMDMKVGFATGMQNGFSGLNSGGFLEREVGLRDLRNGGGSCRIRVDAESGITASKKGSKVWKWIFRSSSARNSVERRNAGE